MIFILSGLSGAGKGTLAKVFKEFNIPKAISHTTRDPREGEKEGVDYYFTKDNSLFKNMPASDFHRDVHYGTSKQEFSKASNVWCEMSLKGMQDLKDYYGEDNVVPIWVHASLEECADRLKKRDGTEKAKHRIETNKREVGHSQYYDYGISNYDGELEEGRRVLRGIIEANIDGGV